jgi:hypothetical protein
VSVYEIQIAEETGATVLQSGMIELHAAGPTRDTCPVGHSLGDRVTWRIMLSPAHARMLSDDLLRAAAAAAPRDGVVA